MNFVITWWRHQMETFSALLVICAGNSPVPGEFPTHRPVTRSFDVYFDLRPNKRPSKQSWGWWFETPSRPLWRHRNEGSNCLNQWIPFDWRICASSGLNVLNLLSLCSLQIKKNPPNRIEQAILIWLAINKSGNRSLTPVSASCRPCLYWGLR